MKKLKFSGKLNLNKETVAKLSGDQMKEVNGGLHSKYENAGTSMAWAVGSHNTCNCEGFSCVEGIPSRLNYSK